MTNAPALRSFLALPWNAFVGAFLYYTLLTLIVIGAADLSGTFVATAYLFPLGAYAGVLVSRALHGLVAFLVEMVGPHKRGIARQPGFGYRLVPR